ncbi:hypothetical protein AVEN_137195-1 [Araneus ventricosus]|uniref:Uncharacterized protein n=1 Tax=Araneus ventricosus TaxID=182803 RepID=A0A4Y2MWW9_ARAVE|nr:hypothetical protein AVEN_137195-1 [Araneus ventricosus]
MSLLRRRHNTTIYVQKVLIPLPNVTNSASVCTAGYVEWILKLPGFSRHEASASNACGKTPLILPQKHRRASLLFQIAIQPRVGFRFSGGLVARTSAGSRAETRLPIFTDLENRYPKPNQAPNSIESRLKSPSSSKLQT